MSSQSYIFYVSKGLKGLWLCLVVCMYLFGFKAKQIHAHHHGIFWANHKFKMQGLAVASVVLRQMLGVAFYSFGSFVGSHSSIVEPF